VNPAAELALATRYDVAAPRYTSYPTVPYWDSPPSVAQWLALLRRALARPDASPGLYLHIPFCSSLCTYCGCNTRITRSHSLVAPYLKSLLHELDLYLEALGRSTLTLTELYLGGGTPTFLAPSELQELLSGLFARVGLAAGADAALEADPRVTTAEQLAVLARQGFRRLSLGIEDFDPRVQQIVNRVQSEQQVREVTCAARELGFDSIHFDLI
jgi:oxygen-independent coproporphyrinogen-3 oxidase